MSDPRLANLKGHTHTLLKDDTQSAAAVMHCVIITPHHHDGVQEAKLGRLEAVQLLG
jgi:hypothetical protein